MIHMKIIVFTGMPFAGKSIAVDVARAKNIPVIRMGDFVWEETRKQGKPLTADEVGAVANTMREKEGKDIWARRTVDALKRYRRLPLIIIDGARNPEEITYFKEKLGADCHVVAIIAPDELRYQRARERGRVDDSTSHADITERDLRETGWGLPKVIAAADVTLHNDGSLVSFQTQVERIIKLLASRR
jgi:dephospho-CoA kinase